MYTMSETMLLVQDSSASIRGVQGRSNGQGTVVARAQDLIAVLWPSTRLYHSEGGFTSYQPATIEVYRIRKIETGAETGFHCTPTLEWTSGRRPVPLPLDRRGNPANN